ncbi:hypothetical protein WMY93_028580 [Mugilogobius chulae]|uniref:Uncharacterized protein n=1 Tax=Mugilogobius chulae TaxID=88201 RepID=A0AAW0MUY3_9GOBI
MCFGPTITLTGAAMLEEEGLFTFRAGLPQRLYCPTGAQYVHAGGGREDSHHRVHLKEEQKHSEHRVHPVLVSETGGPHMALLTKPKLPGVFGGTGGSEEGVCQEKTQSKTVCPPVPSEEDTIQFLDAIIASCDDEPLRKPYTDDGHADVDFIVATSSAEHDLHSNWSLRVPREPEDSNQTHADQSCANNKSVPKKKSSKGSTSSRLRLQRNPIHLPKVVESAFQTMRLKPRLKKQ